MQFMGICRQHLSALPTRQYNCTDFFKNRSNSPQSVRPAAVSCRPTVSATRLNQHAIALRPPLLVGFFLAALIIHGGCQQWWIGPVLGTLSKWPLMLAAAILTAFNDNAAITYLASLVPGFSDALKYVVMAGAVTGGGLTVIANSPNPAGQSILASRFGEAGISPLYLFLGALVPTLIAGVAFIRIRTPNRRSSDFVLCKIFSRRVRSLCRR
jgi:hypothetical protein